MEVETDLKILKLNNFFAYLNFRIYVPAFAQSLMDRRAMLLFRNSSTVSLFLCRVGTAQPSKTQSRSLNTILDMLLCCMKIVCFFTSLFLWCLMTALKGKGKSAVKMGMQYGKLITDSRFYKPPKWKRKTVSGLLPGQFVTQQFVCIVVLQHKGD